MANLHTDIITDILSRLPVKSLLRFRSVCKAWNSLINDARFINMHLHQAINNNNFNLILSFDRVLHSIDYDSHYTKAIELDHPDKLDYFSVFGSSNGLVNIQFYDIFDESKFDVLWNPCTKEFRVLPESSWNPDVLDDSLMVCELRGFGYSPIMDDYRIIEVYQVFNQDMQFLSSQVMVYSLEMDSWKMVDGAPYYISSAPQLPTNENPHWPALAHPGANFPKSIAYFDLADEIFCEIQYPKSVRNVINVGVLGGCLCVVGGLEQTRSDVWVMKEYGVLESWTKLFTINSSTVIPSIKASTFLFSDKNGKVLLDNECGDLVLYDPKCETVEALEIQGLPTDWHEIHVYVETLVSLKSCTYVDREKCRAKRRQTKKRRNMEMICPPMDAT